MSISWGACVQESLCWEEQRCCTGEEAVLSAPKVIVGRAIRDNANVAKTDLTHGQGDSARRWSPTQ